MNKRNLQVDGLRGMMALMIVVFHLFCRYIQIYQSGNIAWMSFWGSLGTTVFVTISGYFLGAECIRYRDNELRFKMKAFLWKKLLRLWPCYVLAISITMLAIKLTKGGLPGRECSWFDYFLNMIFINGFIGTPYVDGAHWYLTTLLALIAVFAIIRKLEIDKYVFTYVIWLVLVMLFYKFHFIAIAGLGGGAYLGVAIVGVSMAWIIADKENCLVWVLLLFFAVFYSAYIQGIYWIFYNIFSIGVLYLCIRERIEIFDCGIFQFLGKISYPWYLIHQNLAYLLIIKMENKWGGYSSIYSFIALIVTFVIAIGIWIIDKKFALNKIRRLKRYRIVKK